MNYCCRFVGLSKHDDDDDDDNQGTGQAYKRRGGAPTHIANYFHPILLHSTRRRHCCRGSFSHGHGRVREADNIMAKSLNCPRIYILQNIIIFVISSFLSDKFWKIIINSLFKMAFVASDLKLLEVECALLLLLPPISATDEPIDTSIIRCRGRRLKCASRVISGWVP